MRLRQSFVLCAGYCSRGAENRTRSIWSQTRRTTGILRPETMEKCLLASISTESKGRKLCLQPSQLSLCFTIPNRRGESYAFSPRRSICIIFRLSRRGGSSTCSPTTSFFLCSERIPYTFFFFYPQSTFCSFHSMVWYRDSTHV